MPKPAYFVFETTIRAPDKMTPYLAKVAETLEPFGGKRLVVGGKVLPVEGSAPQGVFVILEFADVATAHAWYASPAYQEILGHRHAASDSDAFIVEGFDAVP